MKFIYIFNGCSNQRYKELIEKKGLRISQQAQKYNRLMIEGIAKNSFEVCAVSTQPINRIVSKNFYFGKSSESVDGVQYNYLSFINFRYLRELTILINSFFKMLRLADKETVILCDVLNVSASIGTLIAAKIKHVNTIGIVTDIPMYRPTTSYSQKVLLTQRINYNLLKKYSGYIFLTEEMNLLINQRKKPYIVMEGHVDINKQQSENTLENKYKEKVCIYAGSLRSVYGIEILVDGFIKAAIDNSELHIYGEGDYVKKLKKKVKQYPFIKYFGVKSNDFVVTEQYKATLLINPRPTKDAYTKYSFPSKNMEYMASGTAVLTTHLPGMPKDHEKYVYLIEQENADGIAKNIKEILSQTPEQLHNFGLIARDFVYREKSNVKQASKLISFIKGEFNFND